MKAAGQHRRSFGSGIAPLACLLLLCIPGQTRGQGFYDPSLDGRGTVIQGAGYDLGGPFVADPDGDGRDDLIFGLTRVDKPAGDENAGVVHIFWNRPAWPSSWDLAQTPADVTIWGAEPFDRLELYGTGDLDGDGRDDLVLKSWSPLEVLVLLGRDTWPAEIDLAVTEPDIRIVRGSGGSVLATAVTDVNGDALSDLVLHVSGQGFPFPGHLMVLYGRATWPARWDLESDAPDLEIVLSGSVYYTPAGDLTGDGVPDLLLSHRVDPPGETRPAVLYGQSPWPARIDLTVTGPDLVLDHVDSYMAEIGHVAGDGTADLLIFDRGDSADRGRIRVYEGGPDLGAGPPVLQVLGRNAGDGAGFRLETRPWIAAEDMDTDGHNDLVFSVLDDGLRNRRPDAGSIAVLRGPLAPGVRDLGQAHPDLTFLGPARYAKLLEFDAGDLDGDGARDLAAGSLEHEQVHLWFGLEPTPLPSVPDLYVDAFDGDDGRAGTSWSESLRSIRAALEILDASVGPATVHVARGFYRESLVVGDGTTLLGGYVAGGGRRDPSLNTTTLQSRGGSAVTIRAGGAGGPVRVDGFRITGGRAENGGGVLLESGVAILTGNTITGNTAVLEIRGVDMFCPIPVHCHTLCATSRSGLGAGIQVESEVRSARIVNNLVHGNWIEETFTPGACDVGICFGARWAEDWDCDTSLLYRGPNGAGTGVYAAEGDADVTIENNTIVGNWIEPVGGAVDIGGWNPRDLQLGTVTGQEVDLLHNIAESALCGSHTGLSVSGNLFESEHLCNDLAPVSGDPYFVDADNGDFRLSQFASGQPVQSAAVDAGGLPAADVCIPGSPGDCMDDLTTRTDSVPDTGMVDLGFHHSGPLNLPPLRAGAPEVRTAGACALRISWSPATDPEGDHPIEYLLYRAWSSGGPDLNEWVIAATLSTSFLDEGLSWDQSYRYKVRARDALGNLGPSSAAEWGTTTDDEGPVFPLLSVTHIDDCRVQVEFDIEDGCSGVGSLAELHRSLEPGFAPNLATRVATRPWSPWEDTVPRNGNYYYRLAAEDDAGNRTQSRQTAVLVSGCDGLFPEPGMARIQRILRDSDGLAFEILPAFGATSHRLYRGGLSTLHGAGYDHAADIGPDGLLGTQDDTGSCNLENGGFLDPTALWPGSFYFLAVGVNFAGEGLYGTDSAELARPDGPTLGTTRCP